MLEVVGAGATWAAGVVVVVWVELVEAFEVVEVDEVVVCVEAVKPAASTEALVVVRDVEVEVSPRRAFFAF